MRDNTGERENGELLSDFDYEGKGRLEVFETEGLTILTIYFPFIIYSAVHSLWGITCISNPC